MIPLLAMIISIYCCLRLIEMGLAAYDRSGKEPRDVFAISNGLTDASCFLYFCGAVAIAILCSVIIYRSVEAELKAEHQMRLDAKGAEFDRKAEADTKKFNDDTHAKIADVLKRLGQVGQPQ